VEVAKQQGALDDPNSSSQQDEGAKHGLDLDNFI